jgi:hypothetical protein
MQESATLDFLQMFKGLLYTLLLCTMACTLHTAGGEADIQASESDPYRYLWTWSQIKLSNQTKLNKLSDQIKNYKTCLNHCLKITFRSQFADKARHFNEKIYYLMP